MLNIYIFVHNPGKIFTKYYEHDMGGKKDKTQNVCKSGLIRKKIDETYPFLI